MTLDTRKSLLEKIQERWEEENTEYAIQLALRALNAGQPIDDILERYGNPDDYLLSSCVHSKKKHLNASRGSNQSNR